MRGCLRLMGGNERVDCDGRLQCLKKKKEEEDFCGIKTTEFGARKYFLIEGPCTEVGCGVIYKQEEDH